MPRNINACLKLVEPIWVEFDPKQADSTHHIACSVTNLHSEPIILHSLQLRVKGAHSKDTIAAEFEKYYRVEMEEVSQRLVSWDISYRNNNVLFLDSLSYPPGDRREVHICSVHYTSTAASELIEHNDEQSKWRFSSGHYTLLDVSAVPHALYLPGI